MLKTPFSKSLPLAMLGVAAFALPASADWGRYQDASYRGGGGGVILHADANFRGRCEIVDSSTARLNAYRLNDNVSSLRPVSYRGDRGKGHRGRRGGELVLFQDSAQRGQAIEISHDVADLSQYRFNDRASSFLITGGTWQVCEHANFRGRCEVLQAGAGDLKPIRMNDNISSIRAYRGWR